MTSPKLRSAASVALLTLFASALGWVDWRLSALPVSLPPATSADQAVLSAPAPAATSQAEAVVPEFTRYRVIAERPLFLPGRRVGSLAAPQPVSAPVPAAPQWQLSGIMLSGEAARALLKADDSRPATWVRQDEEISGWRVVRIDARGVLLESAGVEQLVELYPVRIGETSPAQ